MLTLLAVIGVLVVLFVAAVVATRNDEVLIDVLPDAADLDLPTTAIQAQDLAGLRFSQALRGYRMEEVDGVLERVSAELADRDRRLGALQAELLTARRAGPGGSGAVRPVTPPEAPAAPPVTLTKPAPPAPVTLTKPAPGRPVARSDSPLSGFSLPDISPVGWTADRPATGTAAAPSSAATPESGEWFFDPDRSEAVGPDPTDPPLR